MSMEAARAVQGKQGKLKLAAKRNNSGTFNLDNPKKMKKTVKGSSPEDKQTTRKKMKHPTVSDGGDGMALKPPSRKRKQSNGDYLDSMELKPSQPKKKWTEENGNVDASFPKTRKLPMKGQSNVRKGFKSLPNAKYSDKAQEKPDWNKLKEEKKALREKRRAAQKDADGYEVSIESKKIMESIRSRKCPAAEQIKQLGKLFSLLKGKLIMVVYAHDMSRVVETMLKLAHTHKQSDILLQMVRELLPEVLEMSKRKYATHVVRMMIAHSLPPERKQIVKRFQGHVLKLLNNKYGKVVLEQLYLKSKQEEQCQLKKELYGGSHMLITSETVTGLDIIFKNLPNMKESTLANTKQNLLKLFEKDAVESNIVHSVLLDYLSFADTDDSSEILEHARNHIKALTLSKEGVHVSMMCMWMGSPKARKKIVKDLKGNVVSLACGEHTHLLLLAIFDSMDDTVFIQKAILTELLTGDLSLLLANTYGRKVLMYLCSRRDPIMFSAPVVAVLSTGDTNPVSKKDAALRASELQTFAVPLLLEHIIANTVQWMNNNSNLLILLAAVKAGLGDQLELVLKAIAETVTNPPNPKHKGIDLSIADNTGCHMVLKKLAQHDKLFAENGCATFGAAIVAELTDQHYLAWLKNNHCCFLLLELLKNGSEEVIQKLKSKIKSISASIWKKKESIPAGGKKIQEML